VLIVDRRCRCEAARRARTRASPRSRSRARLGASVRVRPPRRPAATGAADRARETTRASRARVFKIQFKDPSDVAQLVGQLLTEKGR
jgi:hypothetical protein